MKDKHTFYWDIKRRHYYLDNMPLKGLVGIEVFKEREGTLVHLRLQVDEIDDKLAMQRMLESIEENLTE